MLYSVFSIAIPTQRIHHYDDDQRAAASHLCVSAEAGLQDVGEFGVPKGDMESVAPQSAEHLQQETGNTQTYCYNIPSMSCWGRH